MRAADRTEYIVQALMEAGAMYEDGARSFLAEHDADRHAEVLNEAARVADGLPTPEDCSGFSSADEAWDNGTYAVAAELRRMATAGKASPAGPTASQPAALPDAEIEFAATGALALADWHYLELLPDFYGDTYMQIGGWLPEGWDSRRTPSHTARMVKAVLPGRSVPPNLDVTVEVKGYGGPRRFMKIQWRKDGAR